MSKKALDESIDHWNNDVIFYLKDGWAVSSMNTLSRNGSRITLQDRTTHCPLCIENKTPHGCGECDYFVFYGCKCDSTVRGEYKKRGHWNIWRERLNLQGAIQMVNSLHKIKESGNKVEMK